VPVRTSVTRNPGGLPSNGSVRKVLKYAGGSVVATVCSELMLVVCYGLLHVSAGWSSCAAWLAGAVPNYWLNRSWTWPQRGRPNLVRETLPYVGIVLGTLLLAVLATRASDAVLRHSQASSELRVVLVAATLLGVYVVMFFLRYFLFDRLFTRLSRSSEAELSARSIKETATSKTAAE
jgi:putative flippase GtrA